MPFYEYQCSACQHQVEVLQKISDTPLRKCPECGKSTLKRLISAPVFRLKGGGWYETDFKSDKEQKRNIHGREDAPDSKSEEGAKASSSATSTEEAKPAEAKSAKAKPAASKAPAKPAARSKSAAKPASRAKPAKAAAKKRTSR